MKSCCLSRKQRAIATASWLCFSNMDKNSLTHKSNYCNKSVFNLNVNVNGEFKVTLHEQVGYRGTLQY